MSPYQPHPWESSTGPEGRCDVCGEYDDATVHRAFQPMRPIAIELPWWCAAMTGIGIIAIWAVLLALVTHARMIDAQATRMTTLERDVARLQGQCDAAREVIVRFEEFQRWREHLTVASRMGYRAADRYLRDYPLELPPDYATEQ